MGEDILLLMNHNIAGNQPISEIISDPNVAFNLGIVLGFLIGFILGIFIYALWRDSRDEKM
jgi:uncharacterized phage infection (PIP) family protein YhgE